MPGCTDSACAESVPGEENRRRNRRNAAAMCFRA
jgi:hypothetical protein